MRSVLRKFKHLCAQHAPAALLLALAGLSSSPALAQQWFAQLIALRTASPEIEISCTASLLKVQGQCALLTDYHCVPETPGLEARIHVSYPHPTGALGGYGRGAGDVSFDWVEDKTLPVEVLRRDRASDLALLSIPPELQSRCDSLVELKIQDPVDYAKKYDLVGSVRQMRSHRYSALGFVGDRVEHTYSSDIPWQGGNGGSDVSLYRYGPRSNDVVYELRELNLIPGMSGGLTISIDGVIIGLNSRFIPFQEAMFVTPIARVAEFVAGTITSPDFLADLPGMSAIKVPVGSNKTSGAGGGNGHVGGGGGNGHVGGGGGNGHTGGGGGNGHVGGGDSGTMISPLQIAGEPDEGVLFPGHPNMILLGVDGRQIDGTDDYWLRYVPQLQAKGGPKNVVTRPVDGYPDSLVRQQLIKRLGGFYKYAESVGMQKAQHMIYRADPRASFGWDLEYSGNDMFGIDLDPSKRRLRLYMYRHDLSPVAVPFAFTVQAQKHDFEIVPLDKDATRIQLREGALVLDCDNKHYLKLICTNPSIQLSISVDATGRPGRTLTYRILSLTSAKGQTQFNYQFGTLLEGTKKERDWAEESFYP